MANKWSKKGQAVSYENGGLTLEQSKANRLKANAFCQKRPADVKQLWTKEELAEYKNIVNGFEFEKRALCMDNFGTKEKIASFLSTPFMLPFLFAMTWYGWKLAQGDKV